MFTFHYSIAIGIRTNREIVITVNDTTPITKHIWFNLIDENLVAMLPKNNIDA